MKDMTDEQRKAARAVMNAYPALQLKMSRSDGYVVLTPMRGSNYSGEPVTVTYGATHPRQLSKELQQSCADLMGQV